jgi:hypothetical protein
VWAAACLRRAWRLIKARRACLHAMRSRSARIALPVLQAVLRRRLSAPRLKIGARVRLAAGAAAHGSFQVAYAKRGANTLTHDTHGTVIEIYRGQYRRYPALVESDDIACPALSYYEGDLEPIIDGNPAAALAFERERHARRHQAAVRLQALTRGRSVRRQHTAAARVRAQVRCALRQIRSRCEQAAQRLQAHVRCATARSRLRLQPPSSPGAPAFTFGGVRK